MVALMLGLSLGVQDTTELRHPDPPFQFVIPKGFERTPPAKGQTYAFRHALGPDGERGKVISVEVLNGVIDRSSAEELLKAAEGMRSSLPPGARIRPLSETWKGFELPMLEARYALKGQDLVIYNIQLPLAPRAVQFVFVAPAEEEAGLLDDVRSVLSSVNGKTNWLRPAQRWLALATGVPVLAGWALVILYTIGHLMLFRGKPLRLWRTRLAWLSIALVLFMIGYVMGLVYSESLGRRIDLNPLKLTPAVICLFVADKVRKDGLKARAAPSPPA